MTAANLHKTASPNSSAEPIIKAVDVHKNFGSFHALRGVNMSVQPGEVVVIIGPSGSGKSTFIRTINRLEEHDKGTIVVDGIELKEGQNLDAIRREVGMVFQQFNLFPHLTAAENVMLAPMVVNKTAKKEARDTTAEMLAKVGLSEKMDAYPAQLSGGQQQRVAIARALVARPQVLLADEPTGNLDSKMGADIMDILLKLNAEGTTIVMVSHNEHDAKLAGRVVRVFDGQLVA